MKANVKVRTETISEIKLNSNNELHLVLESGGRPDYQYIYRTATGISWLSDSTSFKVGPLRDWSVEEAYRHIVNSVAQTMNLQLSFSSETAWHNIPEEEQRAIERKNSNQS
ncbi:hypothetical protein [Phaeocystidibacter luteus]|uniref:Uncharacterized protein n=1 Tax=Phaeocystidibacter luteus TaxID=911197 RepID=A0A6N6RKL7_9FLAO|nr:hypothetical protein [Phaeocystidibacter luteus]KAB2807704.1 hypothetical protein F8C67_11730 [Phaeocystidibacter luteus]